MSLFISLCGASAVAQVSGTVFWDYDRNGMQSIVEPYEAGAAHMQVLAYVAGVAQPFSTTTTPDGRFSFSAAQIAPGKRVRLELTGCPLYAFDSPGVGSSIQFVQAPANTIRFAISDPADYCQADPVLSVPLYKTGGSATSCLLTFPSTVLSTVPSELSQPTQLVGNLGTVWATAYHRQSQKLLALSSLKRHASLGPLGLGGIYMASFSSENATATYLDAGNFLTLASDADKATLAARALSFPASFSTANVDGSVFGLIGKIGFGAATFTPAEDQLWAINLYEKTLVSIRVGTPLRNGTTIGADAFTSFSIPQRNTDKGVNRPWAVTYHRGKLYVGVVNDASLSKNRNDLKAYVYCFDLTTQQFNATPVLTVALNYRKGWTVRGTDDASSLGNHWEPWSDNWADYGTNILNSNTSPQQLRVVRPQPILSSIGFDAEGAMLLGFMDRTGHQTSRNQPAPTETAAPSSISVVYSGYSGGDLLRAANIDNAFVLEGNGSAGSHSGSGVGNEQGPPGTSDDGLTASFGEFYAWEQYTPPAPAAAIANEETFTGSLLSNPNLTNVIATVYNPLTTWSGGVSMFDTYNGDLIRRYELYRDAVAPVTTAPRSTFGSGNGVGMLSTICDVAPVEIGNRLWVDTNGDGVQDPDEDALSGVSLSLYTASGRWLASTRTNEQGRYNFRSGLSLPLSYNTTYLVAVGIDLVSEQYDRTNKVLRIGKKTFRLTGWNQGVGVNKANNDSDAFVLSGSSTNLDGLPVMQFRLGVPGEVINNLDAGFQETCDPATAACLPITFRRVR